MLRELARDLLLRREPESVVVGTIEALIRGVTAETDATRASAEGIVEFAAMRLRHDPILEAEDEPEE